MMLSPADHMKWFKENGFFMDLSIDPKEVCRANWRSYGGRCFQALGDTKEQLLYNLFYMIREEAWVTVREINGDKRG